MIQHILCIVSLSTIFVKFFICVSSNDLIILANCNPELQRKRVLIRDKISNTLYEKIIRSQLSFDEKIKFRPKIISTNNLKFIIFIRVVLLLIKILFNLKTEKWKDKES